jgi:hypothetical protein
MASAIRKSSAAMHRAGGDRYRARLQQLRVELRAAMAPLSPGTRTLFGINGNNDPDADLKTMLANGKLRAADLVQTGGRTVRPSAVGGVHRPRGSEFGRNQAAPRED